MAAADDDGERAAAAALALELEASVAEQRRALAAAEAEKGPAAAELAAELRASVAEVEEALGALRPEQQQQEEAPGGRRSGSSKRPRDDDDGGGQPPPRPGGPYRPSPTDFGALARAHPPLRAFLVERRRRGGGGSGRAAPSATTPSAAPAPPAPLLCSSPSPSSWALDFTDWRATRELTAALLRAEYGVRGWSLPEGRLVPPVPNREAYLRWIADLLALAPPPIAPPPPPTLHQQAPLSPLPSPPGAAAAPCEIRGLDIGCGASLIYCLLGAAGWGWRMRGVDADASALEAAAASARAAAAAAPPLAPLLELARAAPCDLAPVAAALARPGLRWSDVPGAGDGVLARALRAEAWEWQGQAEDQGGGQGGGSAPFPLSSSFAFVVCNPPFFESEAEGGRNPRTACGGTAQEMACPGGEAAFVASMVADSAAMALAASGARAGGGGEDGGDAELPPPSVHWFSTMVGKKTTLKAARAALHELMRSPLPDDPPRARVTAVRTTTLAPQADRDGGEGSGSGGGKATPAPTTRWCVAWTFAPSAANTESRPLPARQGVELAAAGAWLSRQE